MLGDGTCCRMNHETGKLDIMQIHENDEMKTIQEMSPNRSGSQWSIVCSPSSSLFIEDSSHVMMMEISESEEKNEPEPTSKKTKNKAVAKETSYLTEVRVLKWCNDLVVTVGKVSFTSKSNLIEEDTQAIFHAESNQLATLKSSGILSIYAVDMENTSEELPSSKPMEFNLRDLQLVSSSNSSSIEMIPCRRWKPSSLFQSYFILLQRHVSHVSIIGIIGNQLVELLRVYDAVPIICYALGTGWIALGYEDGSVALVDTVARTNRGMVCKHESSVSSLCFLHREGGSRYLLSGAMDGTIVVISDASLIDCCHPVQSAIVNMQSLENGLVAILYANDIFVFLTVSAEGKLVVLSSRNALTKEEVHLPPIDRLTLNRQGHYTFVNQGKSLFNHHKNLIPVGNNIVVEDGDGAITIVTTATLASATNYAEGSMELASPSQRMAVVLSPSSCFNEANTHRKQSSHSQHAIRALSALVRELNAT